MKESSSVNILTSADETLKEYNNHRKKLQEQYKNVVETFERLARIKNDMEQALGVVGENVDSSGVKNSRTLLVMSEDDNEIAVEEKPQESQRSSGRKTKKLEPEDDDLIELDEFDLDNIDFDED